MLKNKYFKLFIICFFCYQLFCQENPIVLTGQVIDEYSNAIAYANVVLSDSNRQYGGMTDTNGIFKIKVNRSGEYTLDIFTIGYERNSMEIFLNKNTNIGIITLKQKIIEIGEVTVSYNMPEIIRKEDRYILKLENTNIGNGKTIYEILPVMPGLMVDHNNKISINGISGTSIMINGRILNLKGDDLIGFLKSLRVDDIESVEVISTPTSEYSAEGIAGIIGIRTKTKKSNGFMSNTSLSVRNNTYWSNNVGTGFILKRNRLQLQSSYHYFRNNNYSNYKTKMFYETSSQSQNTEYISNTFQNQHTYRLGANYKINNRNSLYLEHIGSVKNNKDTAENTTYSYSPSTDIINTNGTYYGIKDLLNISTGITHEFQIDTIGQKVTTAFDYAYLEQESLNTYYNGFFSQDNTNLYNLNRKLDIENYTNLYTIQADYIKPFGNTTVFYSGMKYSYILKDDQNKVLFQQEDAWLDDTINNASFDYLEKIIASYIKLSSKISNTKIQFGLRTEYTKQKTIYKDFNNDYANDYFDLFPSIFLKHDFQKENSLECHYSRRISRPPYKYFNLYTYYIDEYTIFIGNQDLKSALVNVSSLSYILKNKYSLSIKHYYTTDYWNEITQKDTTTQTNLILFDNIGNEHFINVTLYLPFEVTNYWQSYNSIGTYYSNVISYDKAYSNGQQTYYFQSYNIFILPKKWKINTQFKYYSKGVDGIYILPQKLLVSISISKDIINSKGTFTLTFYDLFNTMGIYNLSIDNYKNQKNEYQIDKASRYISLSFLYDFSIGENVNKYTRDQSNSKELERIETKY